MAVDAWIDGELPPSSAAVVRAHLEECWDCSAAAETLRLIKRSLANLARDNPPLVASARLRRYAHGLAPP